MKFLIESAGGETSIPGDARWGKYYERGTNERWGYIVEIHDLVGLVSLATDVHIIVQYAPHEDDDHKPLHAIIFYDDFIE